MQKLLSCITCAFLLTATRAYAQVAAVPAVPPVPPVYAVLSLVGDQLVIVVAQPRTDARFAPYRREALLIDGPVFDDAAIRAAVDAIRKVIPRAELSALNTRSPVLFDKQRVLFEEKGPVMAVPEAIRKALQQQQATYLVLVTKHRDELNLQFGQNRDAGGKLEGLGFYVDDTPTANSGETREAVRGFIAPYAYLQVALVDTRTWNVIGKQTITASAAIAAAGAPDAPRLWRAMTPAAKVEAMDRLLRREFDRIIPLLLKAG